MIIILFDDRMICKNSVLHLPDVYEAPKHLFQTI